MIGSCMIVVYYCCVLDVIECVLDSDAKGADLSYEVVGDDDVLAKTLVHEFGVLHELVKVLNDGRNRIHHIIVAVGEELSHFVLLAVLNRPGQASEPHNRLRSRLFTRGTCLKIVAHVSDAAGGLEGSSFQLIHQRQLAVQAVGEFFRRCRRKHRGLVRHGRVIGCASVCARRHGSNASRATGSGHG